MIKKLLLLTIICNISFSFGQNIVFNPMATHYDNMYTVTVYGAGTLYYTTDGTTPTLSSSSAINSFDVIIAQNKEIKVFLVDSSGNTSPVQAKKYYVGTVPTSSIYFKPPTNWINSCVTVDMVNPNSINGMVIDYFAPGLSLQSTGCQGWYKVTANIQYENANLFFNNCPLFQNDPNAQYTGFIYVGNTVFYDYSNGIITDPPSCLILGTSETKENSYTLVKVYPNPADDFLITNSKFDNYIIYDATGKIIDQNKFVSSKINISQLPTGSYLIKLIFKEHKNETVIKFIKK